MTRRARETSRAGLRVTVTDAQGRAIARGPADGLGAWLARSAPGRVRGSLSVAIISDRAMRALNRSFRGRDCVTDVLSFPQRPDRGRLKSTEPAPFLGDVAIARGMAARQARRLGHAVRTEVRVLALHGLLHLLGYDHETDGGTMGRVEDRLRRRAGLPAGLIARR